MSTTRPSPDDREFVPRHEVDELLAETRRRHAIELATHEERHRAAMHRVRTSAPFMVGKLLVDLRSPVGWRKLPGRVRELRTLWRERSRTSVPRWIPRMAEPSRPEKALSLLDEFSHDCLTHEVRLVPAKPSTWRRRIDEVDLVLAESAWNANGSGWSGAFSRFGQSDELGLLLEKASRLGLPTVFWNKEDPVNYDVFIDAARRFDHVFTTDADVVERYKSELGHDRVRPLTFAAQPRIHNPVGRLQGSSREICFAGSWRGGKYPERVRSLTELLHAAANVGTLVIYDRQAGTDEAGGFEGADFGRHVAGALAYPEMLERYRTHGVFLNTNSVVDSPTMVARRVFEILACRTPVVSTPSAAIDHLFGDLVPSPTTRSAAESVLADLMDPDARDRLAQRGYRLVQSSHTYAHRMSDILAAVGIDAPLPAPPSVDVILVSNRPSQLEFALDSYRRQDHPNTRLIFVTNSPEFDLHDVRRRLAEFPDALHLDLPAERTLGECLNAALDHCGGEWFAKFDDDDWYGDAYLSDMLLARNYTDAPVLGKRTNYVYVEGTDETVLRNPGREFSPATHLQGGTLVVRRDAIGSIRFRSLPHGTDTAFLADCDAKGLGIFSTDRFNFILHRRADPDSHTWRITDDEILRESIPVGRGLRTDVAWV